MGSCALFWSCIDFHTGKLGVVLCGASTELDCRSVCQGRNIYDRTVGQLLVETGVRAEGSSGVTIYGKGASEVLLVGSLLV